MPDAVVLALNSVLTASVLAVAAGGAHKGGLVSAVWLAQLTKRNVCNVVVAVVVDFGDGGCGCLATACCWWRRTVLSRVEAGAAHARQG